LALRFVSNLMQPDYVALVRVIITETPRLPQLGSLFRSTVPERAFRSVIDILRMAQDKNLVRLSDLETAARMFLGPLLTYVLLDGLFIGEGPPRRPQPERIEAVVDLYLQAIT
jgi:TetR/AcrR family transcriptional repressor of mexJK operon